MYFMLIEVNNELLKMAIFSFVTALKGLIQPCCAEFQQLQPQFSKTRHQYGSNETGFTLLYLR